jgi:hypothetical protein
VTAAEFRSIPCDSPDCPTVLAGPDDLRLCEDCSSMFEQQGIATHDEQLEFTSEQEEAA